MASSTLRWDCIAIGATILICKLTTFGRAQRQWSLIRFDLCACPFVLPVRTGPVNEVVRSATLVNLALSTFRGGWCQCCFCSLCLLITVCDKYDLQARIQIWIYSGLHFLANMNILVDIFGKNVYKYTWIPFLDVYNSERWMHNSVSGKYGTNSGKSAVVLWKNLP